MGDYKAFSQTILQGLTEAEILASTRVLQSYEKAIASDTGAEFQGNGSALNSAINRVNALRVKIAQFAETAAGLLHTATIALPAGSWLHGIQVNNQVLWGAAAAVMKVGDTADDDGYFTGIDLKATDLLVGEILDTSISTSWGGKEGAYLVAASGRRGPVATNFGKYYVAGSNITGIITVTTPTPTVGRTQMVVVYSQGETVTPVVA